MLYYMFMDHFLFLANDIYHNPFTFSGFVLNSLTLKSVNQTFRKHPTSMVNIQLQNKIFNFYSNFLAFLFRAFIHEMNVRASIA